MRITLFIILIFYTGFVLSQNTINNLIPKKQIDTTLYDNSIFNKPIIDTSKNSNCLMEYISKNTEYPEESLYNGENGKVYIQIFFSNELKRDSLRILFSSGYDALDNSALNMINNTPDSILTKGFDRLRNQSDSMSIEEFNATSKNYVIIPILFFLSDKETPNPIDKALEEANKNLIEGNFLEAKEKYTNILLVSKSNVIAFYNRALATYYLLDYFDACQDWYYAYHLGYSKALDMYYNYCGQEMIVGKYIYDADSLMKENAFVEAEKRYRIANKISPNDTSIILKNAICYYKMHNIEMACNELDTAISLGSNVAYKYSKKLCSDSSLFNYYSIELRNSITNKDYKEANINVTKLIKIQNNNPVLYYQKAEILLKLGNKEEACKYINIALDKGFKNPNIDLNKYCNKQSH